MAEFYFALPVWFAADPSTFTVDESTGRTVFKDSFVIAAVQVRNKTGVALFTDRDLADRYLQERNEPGLLKVEARNPDALLEVLENCALQGFTHVVFDPIPKPALVLLDAVIERVRRGPSTP